jgi:hypothetical protein
MLPYKARGTLHIKWRITKWGDFLGLSGWVYCNHNDPCKRDAEGVWVKRKGVCQQKQLEIQKCHAAGFEDARRSQGMEL